MERPGYVSLWLGKCSTYKELDSYLSGDYTDDGDYIQSSFETDFKIDWFDEDFRDAFCKDFFARDFGKLLSGCSYEKSVIAEFAKHFQLDSKEEFNSGFLLYDFDYHSQIKEITSNSIYLKFIGSVEYDKID
jgi:hypothetical protein